MRVVVVAIRAGGVILIVVERATPQHLPGSLTDRSQPQKYTTTILIFRAIRYAAILVWGIPPRPLGGVLRTQESFRDAR